MRSVRFQNDQTTIQTLESLGPAKKGFLGGVLRQISDCFDLTAVLSTLLSAAVLLFLGSAWADSGTKGLVRVDGSSTVFPITEGAAEEFQKSNKGVFKVTVGISGTGGGFKKFCRGETDIQDASRPILDREIEECRKTNIRYYEFPIAYDAMVIVVNPKNDWISEIDVDALKTMWAPAAQGKIMKWNQVNPNWPDADLKLFGAGSDSGTFDYFTEAIVGKAKSSRGDYTASEDDNALVVGISKQKYALGFLPFSYFQRNKDKLKALAIVGGPSSPLKTKGVLPSVAAVKDGTYFPLSRPLFLYVSEASLKRPEVKAFVSYYLKNASEFATQADYIALPESVYKVSEKNIAAGKLGTVFAGHSEVGMKIEDLMKKERKL